MSQVVDALTPAAVKKMIPAVMTVVSICSKDLPAILRRLTIEYFSNRESKFLTLRNVDLCKEAGIPFNPAQLADPGAYLELAKSICSPIQSKYSASLLSMLCARIVCLTTFVDAVTIVTEKAEKEIGESLFAHYIKPLHHFNHVAQTSCWMRCFDTFQRSYRPRHH
jgi:hypothetical protein